MPYKDKEEALKAKREWISRRRAEAKKAQTGSPSFQVEPESSNQPEERSAALTPQPSQKPSPVVSAGNLPTYKPKTSPPPAPKPSPESHSKDDSLLPKGIITSPDDNYIYMNTLFGRMRLVDSILPLTMRQLKNPPGFALWYHQKGEGKAQPMVICANEQARNQPACPNNIPDFILDDSWGEADVKNLLLSLTSPTGKGL